MRTAAGPFCIALALLFSSVVPGLHAQPYGGPDTLWTRVLAFSDLDDMICREMTLLPDDGIVICGTFWQQEPLQLLVFLSRLDSTGSVVWRQTFDPGFYVLDVHMCPLGTDRFAVVITTYDVSTGYDFVLFAADAAGEIECLRNYTGPLSQWVYAICPTRDGGLFVTYAVDFPHRPAWMKTDSAGNMLMEGSGNLAINGGNLRSVEETPDGGAIIAGHRASAPGGTTVLIRVSPEGEPIFEHQFQIETFMFGYDAIPLADGGYFLCGSTVSNESTSSPWLLFAYRVDSAGDSLWRWVGEDEEYLDELFPQCSQTQDGGFVVSATDLSHANLTRFTPAGQVLWHRQYPVGPCAFAGTVCFDMDSLGRYTFATSCDSSLLVVVRTQPDSTALSVGDHRSPVLPVKLDLTVYPNPFNAVTEIEFMLPVTQRVSLRLYDVLGREVAVLMEGTQQAGKHRVSFDGHGLTSGVYFARLDAMRGVRVQKMVLLR